jgi:predicted amidohydrolase
MNVRLAQLSVHANITENLSNVLAVLEDAQADEWLLFPEGILSGYCPEDEHFTQTLSAEAIDQALAKVKSKVLQKNVHCLLGSVMKDGDDWYNCSLFISPNAEFVYRKNNLSTLDRKHFSAGSALRVYKSTGITFGIQMCRELVFPEQWKLLKKAGAQLIFHINNSIKQSDEVREHLLIARAIENQLWVCSVNNAAAPQAMRSMIIDPFGNVVWQSNAP